MLERKQIKIMWTWLYVFSLITLVVNIVISIITEFSFLSIYGVLGSMMAVMFCNENLNREEVIEVIMKSNSMLLLAMTDKKFADKLVKGAKIKKESGGNENK